MPKPISISLKPLWLKRTFDGVFIAFQHLLVNQEFESRHQTKVGFNLDNLFLYTSIFDWKPLKSVLIFFYIKPIFSYFVHENWIENQQRTFDFKINKNFSNAAWNILILWVLSTIAQFPACEVFRQLILANKVKLYP